MEGFTEKNTPRLSRRSLTADNEHNTTITREKTRRQMISPWNAGFQLGRTHVAEGNTPTVFLGHICIRNPRLFLRDIKKIPNYGPQCRPSVLSTHFPSFSLSTS